MAVESKTMPLGTKAPAFALPDVVTGETVTLERFAEKKALVVLFLCRHCPFVKHVQAELARIGREYADSSVGIVAISSNDATAYPEDAPPRLAAMVREQGFVFPLCHDATQEVARAYDAACTPELYVFGPDRGLVYHGQLDDSRPGNGKPVTGADLRAALDALLEGRPVSPDQRPAVGCSIKWRAR